MTVGDMLGRNANKFPKKLAVVSEGGSWDFETLDKRVNSLSNRLLKMGLQKGDRIGILICIQLCICCGITPSLIWKNCREITNSPTCSDMLDAGGRAVR